MDALMNRAKQSMDGVTKQMKNFLCNPLIPMHLRPVRSFRLIF